MISFFIWAVSFLSLFLAIFWIIVLYTKIASAPGKAEASKKITILVPALNEEQTIARTITSLQASLYKNIEIIVINDGSTDKTAEIVKKFRGVKLINNVHRGIGKSSALNAGLKRATGELLAVVDADTEISKDALNKILPSFNNPKVGAVISTIKIKNLDNFYSRLQRIEYILATFSRVLMSKLDTLHVTPGALSVYRTSLISKLGGFDENNITEDLEIALRLKYYGYAIKIEQNSIAYTNVPSDFKSLWNQRVRWFRGFIYNTGKYRKMFLSKEHGIMGRFQIPINFFTLAAILFSVSLLAYGAIREGYFILLKFLVLRWEILDISYYHLPSFREAVLNVNIGLFFPVAITFLLSLFILHKAHKSINERWSISPSLFIYFTIYPILRSLHWLTAFYKESLRSKRRW